MIENKAGYTATEVACGWAGAIFEVTRPLGQEQCGQRNKIIKKVKCDRRTDKASCRVACTRLKISLFVIPVALLFLMVQILMFVNERQIKISSAIIITC